MKEGFKTVIITALIIFGFSITSCEQESKDGSTSGQLKVHLTDAPFPTDLVAEANVTIDKIEIRKASEDEGYPFITLTEEKMSFNLLELTNGVTASLVDLEVDAGSYDLVRLYVSEASVILSDGTEYGLSVPSGAQTGIKIFIAPALQVAGGLTTELLLDFDVSKSFIVKGDITSSEEIEGFIFKPVIKASNLSVAGKLKGIVSDTSGVSIDGAQVSIIATDTVYTTTFSNEMGSYEIPGIDADPYSVEYAKEGYHPATIEDVVIVEGNATTLNVKLIPENK